MATESAFVDPEALVEATTSQRLRLSVHDASRIAWDFSVPLPSVGQLAYSFQIELAVPTNILAVTDPWAALQSYSRLGTLGDGNDLAGPGAPEALRRAVVAVSAKLARSRDGFVRHCTLIRSSPALEEIHLRALGLWIDAMQGTLTAARTDLLLADQAEEGKARRNERHLADEYLSVQQWTALTDCARALFNTQKALAERAEPDRERLAMTEGQLARALSQEIAYRREAGFAHPENELQLERLLSRMRWLKKHFERVLFLESETYQVATRLGAWFSALGAVLAYLWFFAWQVAIERRQGPVTVGSGIVVFGLLTAVVYASRERLKELGRNWIAGRVQRLFAQRVARYRFAAPRGKRGPLVAAARESFSYSIAHQADPLRPESDSDGRDSTVLRFTHRGRASRPTRTDERTASEVRFAFRFDLSSLFPRLHDAMRGFATPEPGTERISIVDVPRNYEIPIRCALRVGTELEETSRVLILNKNGLVRIEERGS